MHSVFIPSSLLSFKQGWIPNGVAFHVQFTTALNDSFIAPAQASLAT